MQIRMEVEFRSGKFVVHNSSRAFSALPIHQAHAQSNAVIKGYSGAVGITEDPSALRMDGLRSRGQLSGRTI